MKILIIEDEKPAARQLRKLIMACAPAAQILAVLDSVEDSTEWLKNFPPPDLIFLDIQLADGLSFEIFQKVNVQSPIIFTTAYDQYTLKAFKVNSVDYLLKPIEKEELAKAIEKYKKVFQKNEAFDQQLIQQLTSALQRPNYKERFLIKTGKQLAYVETADIAYFYSKDSIVYLQKADKKYHLLDYTLDQLEEVLSSKSFFRINRQFIIHSKAIAKIQTWFNSRLLLELNPIYNGEKVIVSRDRVKAFKQWLGG